MSYFPEYYGGEMWSKALSNMGDNIAGAIEFYRKRHDEMSATDAELGYLHDTKAIDDKAWERIQAARGGEKWNVEQGILHGYELKQQNDLHKAQLSHLRAETQALTQPSIITDPVTGQRMYRGRYGYTPMRTGETNVQNAVNKYSANLGLTPEEFKQIDPSKITMYDQFGKPIDPKTPLPPAYGIASINGKEVRIPVKDLQRFKNYVGVAKQSQQERLGVAMPKVGEVRKGYRYKGGDPTQASSWEKVNAPAGQ